MPQIAVINESTVIQDSDVQKMIPAFGSQWNGDLNTVWGVGQAQFAFVPKKTTPAAGTWWLVFLDDGGFVDDRDLWHGPLPQGDGEYFF